MSNPVLNDNAFSSYNDTLGDSSTHVMSSMGAIAKTGFLSILLALTFSFVWYIKTRGFGDYSRLLETIGLFGGLITALIVCFGPKNNFLILTTSLYALFEGLFLGGLSAEFNSFLPGIVPQAAMATIFTVMGMAVLYLTRIIKCTDKFRTIIYTATFAIFWIYFLQMILNFFNITIPGLYTSSPLGLVVSLAFTVVAAFNLIIDFDFIERFSGRVPKYFEWYGAFALIVTIVWLYIEILDLIAKITTRNN